MSTKISSMKHWLHARIVRSSKKQVSK